MTTANKFTIIRLIMVIPFIIILTIAEILKENISYSKINTTTLLFLVAGVLFILAMITDIIDGYIARKTNTITSFGKLFDPLADKLMTISSFIFFATFKIINIHLVIVFVIRDLLVDGFKNIAIKNNKKFSSNIYGKLKTFSQTIAIILIFFILPLINNNTQQITNSWKLYILNIPVYISLLLSLISGWTYFWNIKSLIKFT